MAKGARAIAEQGIGTASCGPGVLPPYVLHPGPRSFALVLREVAEGRAG